MTTMEERLAGLAYRRSQQFQAESRARRSREAILAAVGQAPDRGLTLLRIAEQTGRSRSTVARIVSVLAGEGAVRVSADPDDARVWRVHPVDGGDRQ